MNLFRFPERFERNVESVSADTGDSGKSIHVSIHRLEIRFPFPNREDEGLPLELHFFHLSFHSVRRRPETFGFLKEIAASHSGLKNESQNFEKNISIYWSQVS
jgi:hypothetical protein